MPCLRRISTGCWSARAQGARGVCHCHAWLHQDTTTIALYGAYEDEPQTTRATGQAYGHSKDGRNDMKQVLLSLGVRGDGGVCALGLRDGNSSDSIETPVAIEECLALGCEGMRGIVADSKAYSAHLGLCLEHGIGLVTLVRTCAYGRTRSLWTATSACLCWWRSRADQGGSGRWHGHSVLRG